MPIQQAHQPAHQVSLTRHHQRVEELCGALVRALTGIWSPLRGSVRLDGAELAQWPEERLGDYIGYLPQEVSLLDATIEENISHLRTDADPMNIVAAAMAAGVHDMIVRLPEGYKTPLGPQGMAISAGQRQRIGVGRRAHR